MDNMKNEKIIELLRDEEIKIKILFIGFDPKNKEEWPLTKKYFIKGKLKINFEKYY